METLSDKIEKIFDENIHIAKLLGVNVVSIIEGIKKEVLQELEGNL